MSPPPSTTDQVLPAPPGATRPELPPLERPNALPRATRDVSLDLVRGLAMVILVVNHLHFESVVEEATSGLLSAAEMLVCVSGVVAGMVFGRRWLTRGRRSTTAMLLRRARTLYVTAVVVVAAVGAARLVPGAATDALTLSRGLDTYAFDGPLRLAVAIVTLEAGPWQFNILSFFVVMLAVTPGLLWMLERGWWPAVLTLSWTLYAVGRAWPVDVLPSQSEQPFPVLVWQLLFVGGLLLGWYRDRIVAILGPWRRFVVGAVLALALCVAYVRLHGPGRDPLGLSALLGFGPGDWARWEQRHFGKDLLDPARVVAMTSMTAAIYLALRRFERPAERTLGWFLLPLGRNSFYVFTIQVFLCLLVASLPALSDGQLGMLGSVVAQIGCLALIWAMIRTRFLFRWIPR